jgi:hypothetical protein
MKLIGPERYNLSFDSKAFKVTCPNRTNGFSKQASSKLPKLYVVSVSGEVVYVGVTKQSMRSRLVLGFTANGRGGYHGYAWRHQFKEATLDIWCQDGPSDNGLLDIETIEAEVVFLARCGGQWPRCQTEIHFHPSDQMHRDIAASVWRTLVSTELLKAASLLAEDNSSD